MFCTEKERKTCEGDELGCKGCYYEHMTEDRFVNEIRKITPFYHAQEPDLETLYEEIKSIIAENERLEDLEDTKFEMFAHISKLQEELEGLRNDLFSANQVINELLGSGDHIPRID